MPDPNKPNDYEKLMKPVEEGPGSADGLPDLEVHHRQACARHRGDGCDCDPDLNSAAERISSAAGPAG